VTLNKILSSATLVAAALSSLVLFCWPLFVAAQSTDEAMLAQSVFIVLMPVILVVVLVEVSSGGLGSKQLAVLGVLIALNAVVRVLGAGTAGIETAFFLIIIGAYVFGAGFGFILGSSSLLVSALLVGGIGPWLPFQMMGAGLVGLGAGLIPKTSKRWSQVLLMMCFAVLAAYLYGALMTMWNWPFLAGSDGALAYVAGAPVTENLMRFLQYEVITGGLLWDTGRAITTASLIALTGPALLATLRRAAGRAGIVRAEL
jgi:energy-coupling factor transport system substrate-specific component